MSPDRDRVSLHDFEKVENRVDTHHEALYVDPAVVPYVEAAKQLRRDLKGRITTLSFAVAATVLGGYALTCWKDDRRAEEIAAKQDALYAQQVALEEQQDALNRIGVEAAIAAGESQKLIRDQVLPEMKTIKKRQGAAQPQRPAAQKPGAPRPARIPPREEKKQTLWNFLTGS